MKKDRVIYTSRVSDHFDMADIFKILEVSEENNRSKGITGALCFQDDTFIQFLEGPTREVNQLLFKISSDPRHQDVQVRYYGESEKSLFGRWSMCEITSDLFEGADFSESQQNMFASLSSSAALRLFERLSERMKFLPH